MASSAAFYILLLTLTEADFECLAKNVYYESRNQTMEGQLAVTFVTTRRALHRWFPDTVCEVVWDNKAFSWTHDGKSDTPYENKEYADIQLLTRSWIENLDHIKDPTGGATHFCEMNTDCYWEKDPDMIFLTRIGGHDFYEERYRR